MGSEISLLLFTGNLESPSVFEISLHSWYIMAYLQADKVKAHRVILAAAVTAIFLFVPEMCKVVGDQKSL